MALKRPRTLPAFTSEEKQRAHSLLAARVAYMMGRKLEEGDWAEVYCRAQNIPLRGWSNLQIDVMNELLGVEHKMLRARSDQDITTLCDQRLMHPSATRSIRVPPVSTDPNDAMRDVLTQYGALIEARRQKVIEQAVQQGEADMRTGWLFWQESLRQFLYFEEEMLPPNPDHYIAEWRSTTGGKSRKTSTNLWVFERETGIKRYSVTNEAGAKIQPYFDVPSSNDPNLYIWTVLGEHISDGTVRVWTTEATARELERLLGQLDAATLSRSVLEVASLLAGQDPIQQATAEIARSLLISAEAYKALHHALPGVSDEHSLQLLAQHLREAS